MLKQEITTALIQATKKQDRDSINTIRLILAVIKDKEISMRSNDSSNEITDNEIVYELKFIPEDSEEYDEFGSSVSRPLAANSACKLSLILITV